MKLYRLNVTADGEPSIIFALAEDVDSLLHALEYEGHGEADEESLLPYFDADKKPRVVRSLEDVPEDYLDFVCLGDNPEEYTVAEFFDTQEKSLKWCRSPGAGGRGEPGVPHQAFLKRRRPLSARSACAAL
jgi:hypothetical protein